MLGEKCSDDLLKYHVFMAFSKKVKIPSDLVTINPSDSTQLPFRWMLFTAIVLWATTLARLSMASHCHHRGYDHHIEIFLWLQKIYVYSVCWNDHHDVIVITMISVNHRANHIYISCISGYVPNISSRFKSTIFEGGVLWNSLLRYRA